MDNLFISVPKASHCNTGLVVTQLGIGSLIVVCPKYIMLFPVFMLQFKSQKWLIIKKTRSFMILIANHCKIRPFYH